METLTRYVHFSAAASLGGLTAKDSGNRILNSGSD